MGPEPDDLLNPTISLTEGERDLKAVVTKMWVTTVTTRPTGTRSEQTELKFLPG